MNGKTLVYVGAGAAALLALAYVAKRIKDAAPSSIAEAASTATRATIGAASDAAAGVVLGVSDWAGIPRTNPDQCDQDLASGRTWEASFSCDAGRFIKAQTGSYTPQNVGGYRMEGRNYPTVIDTPSYGSGQTLPVTAADSLNWGY